MRQLSPDNMSATPVQAANAAAYPAPGKRTLVDQAGAPGVQRQAVEGSNGAAELRTPPGNAPGAAAGGDRVQQLFGVPGRGGTAMPVWVELSPDGKWNGQEVLANLARQASVPEDLKAAILAGANQTAVYCAELRKRVRAAGSDPAKQAECEQIANALTSRITELIYATSRSPLQYSQLADVARWAGEYTGPAGAQAPAPEAQADKPPLGAADKDNQAAEDYATKLASAPGGRVREGDKDQIRNAAFQANDEHPGEESGNAALAGWSFLRDPFDNTVTARRPDGTGLQCTYVIEKPGEDGEPKVTLVRTVELSELRSKALRRQDKMAPIELQEGADGPQKRKDRDAANGKAAREKYRKEHPGVVEEWERKMADWQKGDKKTKPPTPPLGYQVNDLKTTLCTATPGDVYHAAGGNLKDGFPFTPPKDWPTWRSLATHPEGPRPGDVYYLWDIAKNQAAHMGVFKSAAPVPGTEDLWTWVVTDGGQGGYDRVQEAQERTRGPFNKKTGIFSSSIAEAGQSKGDRKLVGWVDIDAFRADHP